VRTASPPRRDPVRKRRRRRGAAAWALTLAAVGIGGARAADDLGAIDASDYPGLIWHAETLDGRVLSSRSADRAVNPASVVKVATTLWALRDLGPDARFETRFLVDGSVGEDGTLAGDLVVEGGADPDFHLENAFAVARRLNERGIAQVTGALVVHGPFWLGWEGGSEKRLADPDERARLMATRLRSALDPHRWPRTTQRAWREYAQEHGLDPARPPRVAVAGDALARPGPATGRPVLVHRSKTASAVLRRFNCWSNNDIERFEESLGPPEALAATLRGSWGETTADGVRLSSTSGLGENRMSPRQIVRLLRDLDRATRDAGLAPEAVLPVAGCDPGTLRAFFPTLNGDGFAGAVVGKTGTLVYTDRGVSAFAGIARTARGEFAFAAIYPKAGRRMHWARRMEERLVVDLIESAGGPAPRACPDPPLGPDDGAVVFDADRDPRPVATPR